jgi:biopolymer transport protein ExbB
MYETGGWVMHPITLCSLLSIAAIVYKVGQLRRARTDTGRFLTEIRSLLLSGKMREALEACDRSAGPLAVMVKAGLLRHGRDRVDVEEAMRTAAVGELARLERYLGLLATIVNVAPLLGFFGTVWGMIVAFDVVHEQGLANPGAVAHGISQALYTTAWGLVVAFVTLPFHNWFAAKAAEHARTLEMGAGLVLETFAEMDRMGTKA